MVALRGFRVDGTGIPRGLLGGRAHKNHRPWGLRHRLSIQDLLHVQGHMQEDHLHEGALSIYYTDAFFVMLKKLRVFIWRNESQTPESEGVAKQGNMMPPRSLVMKPIKPAMRNSETRGQTN